MKFRFLYNWYSQSEAQVLQAFKPYDMWYYFKFSLIVTQYFRTFSGNIKSKDTLFYLHACVCVLSHVQLFVIPWTVACQVPLSIEFSSHQYWSGLLFPILGIFLTQRSNPHLLHWQVNFYYCATWNALKQRQKRQMISLLFTHHYSSFIISYCVGFFIS